MARLGHPLTPFIQLASHPLVSPLAIVPKRSDPEGIMPAQAVRPTTQTESKLDRLIHCPGKFEEPVHFIFHQSLITLARKNDRVLVLLIPKSTHSNWFGIC